MILGLLTARTGCSRGGQDGTVDLYGLKGRNGAAEARRDLAKGTPSYKAFGLPHPATGQYAVLLKKRMNITYDPIAGCEVDEYLLEYAKRYNTVILKYVDKKYGPKAMDRLWEEALKEYEAKNGGSS
jgi:hypothetical protein